MPAQSAASIEKTLAKGKRERSQETKQQLAIGTDRMNALRDKTRRIRCNMDETIKVAERVYGDLHGRNTRTGKQQC